MRGPTPSEAPLLVPPLISLTSSPRSSSPMPEAGEGDYDDGPEYLAIGNQGQRSRQDSRSSTPAESTAPPPPRRSSLAVAPPPPRRSSFSEGQRGPARVTRGHIRSISDTGVDQKRQGGSANR